uniref:Uncharacterized protein n=1 Tax=Rhizophora mucronata TaxID=61149 RepID=A0A2P2PN09_RHIMU
MGTINEVLQGQFTCLRRPRVKGKPANTQINKKTEVSRCATIAQVVASCHLHPKLVPFDTPSTNLSNDDLYSLTRGWGSINHWTKACSRHSLLPSHAPPLRAAVT